MANNAPTLDEAKAMLEARLSELGEEQARLQGALASLNGDPKHARRSHTSTPTTTGRRRRRRGGTRAEHALKAVQDKPGITGSEIAEKLKIKPNYVYQVMAVLVKDGKVAKDGRGYIAKA